MRVKRSKQWPTPEVNDKTVTIQITPYTHRYVDTDTDAEAEPHSQIQMQMQLATGNWLK